MKRQPRFQWKKHLIQWYPVEGISLVNLQLRLFQNITESMRELHVYYLFSISVKTGAGIENRQVTLITTF